MIQMLISSFPFPDLSSSRNKLTIIAEPLEKGLAEDIESGKINIKMPPRELGKHLQEVSFEGTIEF